MTEYLEEISKKIIRNRKKRFTIFQELPIEAKAQSLLILPKKIKKELVEKLSKEELVKIMEFLDPDETTDVLRLLNKRKQDETVATLTEHIKVHVSTLLKFDAETAGSIMNLDYIQVDIDDTIESVVAQFMTHEERTGKLPVIIVTENQKFAGYLSIEKLTLGKRTDKARDHISDLKTIDQQGNYKQILELFRKYPHDKIAVLNEKEAVIGIIYSQDVLKILNESESKSLYDFAGLSNEEDVHDSAFAKVKYRYIWLIINLGTAFLAASVVGIFGKVIEKNVLLAVYMPIVAGMGGNSAVQTLAVMVRGISLKQITLDNFFDTLKNELIAGLVNGIINGIIVAAIVIIVNANLKVAFILSAAMIINLLVASFFGTLIPLIMQKLKKDPATSATIFITTATDVLGFMAFLGLASILL